MKKLTLILLLMTFGVSSTAFAELFKWKDDDGMPHMTDRLDKVPKKYRDSVIIKEEGKNSNLSYSHGKKAPATRNQVNSDPSKPYNGRSITDWVNMIQALRDSITQDRETIEAKKLVVESFESSMDYSKDLNFQMKDLKSRLAQIKARKVHKKDYPAAQKKRDIYRISKQIKRVRARKNANVIKDDKRDALKASTDEIVVIEQSIKEKQQKLIDLKQDAIKAGVPQKHLIK